SPWGRPLPPSRRRAGPTRRVAGRGQGRRRVGDRQVARALALDAGGERTGPGGQPAYGDAVRWPRRVRLDPVRGAVQQARRTDGVAAPGVGDPDGQLRESLPQLAFLVAGRLP